MPASAGVEVKGGLPQLDVSRGSAAIGGDRKAVGGVAQSRGDVQRGFARGGGHETAQDFTGELRPKEGNAGVESYESKKVGILEFMREVKVEMVVADGSSESGERSMGSGWENP